MTYRRCILGISIISATVVLACRDIVGSGTGTGAGGSPAALLNSPGQVVVFPDSMHGWVFYNDQQGSQCADAQVCRFVIGPDGVPAGTGSAELATTVSTDGKALILADYAGTRFDAVTALSYTTFRQTADAGNNLAIALQFNVDFDLTDSATGYQGRLVFEPYHGNSGNVLQNVWQAWDAKAGHWWGTRSSVSKDGIATTNPCVQAAPCLWSELLALFPDVGVHATFGAVILKAGSGWSGFRGNVDNLTIGVGGVNTTFDFELSSPVPALPPDTLPVWIHADSNLIDGGDVIAGRLAKNVIMVAFEEGTPVADRTAAIASVNGAVVGGVPTDIAEGIYWVRIQAATPQAILDAADSVNSAAGVAFAVADLMAHTEVDYLRPDDSALMRTLRLNPDSAAGDNWALERIAAPLAWGCSAGSTDTRIAVLDIGFHPVADLTPNVQGSVRYSPTTTDGHGTSVAAILGAKGNNGAGISGVMWNADLRLYERTPTAVENVLGLSDLTTDFVRLLSAVANGARVINLSGTVRVEINGQRVRIPENAAGQAAVENIRRMIRRVVRLRDGSTTAPLFVFSAGNDARDAYYNGYPAVALDYPNRVLNVAAVAIGGGLTTMSNFGTLVQIAAPGEQTLTIDQHGAVTTGFGRTSGAAPYVSGVAGLLASFDPSLSPAQIREHIIQGAIAGGRFAGGIPLLNAHEALKRAAQRPSAPLCGQRVWVDNGSVYAERTPGGAPELLASIGSVAYDLNVFHGGKHIDYQTAGGFGHLRYESGAWGATADWFDGLPGATYSSSSGGSHDGTAGMIGDRFTDEAQPNLEFVLVMIGDSTGERGDTVAFQLGPLGHDRGGNDRLPLTYVVGFARAFPQRGDTALVAITRMRGSSEDTSYPCVDDRGIPTTCVTARYVYTADTAFLYSINTRIGSPSLRLVRVLPDTIVYSLGFSENDSSTVVTFGAHVETITSNGSSTTQEWCTIQYLDHRAKGNPQRSISSLDACKQGLSGNAQAGAGTLSALRMTDGSQATRVRQGPISARRQPRHFPLPRRKPGAVRP